MSFSNWNIDICDSGKESLRELIEKKIEQADMESSKWKMILRSIDNAEGHD